MKVLTEPPVIAFIRVALDPFVCSLSFLVFMFYYNMPWDIYYSILFVFSILFASVISKVLQPLCNFREGNLYIYIIALLVESATFITLIYLLIIETQLSQHFYKPLVLAWLASIPISLIVVHSGLHLWLKYRHDNSQLRKCAIVGATKLAHILNKEIANDPGLLMQVDGYFDSREKNRICPECRDKILGNTDDVLAYVKKHGIQILFITLPIKGEGRIIRLLNELRDTTVSIYFVPDIFVFDLIQSRVDTIHNIPIVSVLETPIHHMNVIWKGAFDLIVSSIILLLIFPLLVLIALGVKLSSHGPILFKQARYGLDGKQINVFKFRTMTICENGSTIQQAKRNDPRIYPFGAFLRRTSLDELPQFFNVLRGDMSIVGPRPHAVAHNEEYRQIIHSYMLRHKVKPGITGWAQVHGLRGETDTLEKMEQRVYYDLEYLKKWSLLLDIWIIIRTWGVVLSATNAH